jgi:hypothetical protein
VRNKAKKLFLEQYMKKYYFAIVFFSMLFLIDCSTRNLSYSPTSTYVENDERNITDEDIRKAFDAQPQLKIPVKIAWYNLGNDTLLQKLFIIDKNITLNYEIPKTLVEGFSQNSNYNRSYYYNKPININIKSLRLLSARAKCDILILVSSKFEEKQEPNYLYTSIILLFPPLFLPVFDVTYDYEAELFIFDVRNGYLYKHLKSKPETIIKKYEYLSELEETAKKMNDKFEEEVAIYFCKELNIFFQISQ